MTRSLHEIEDIFGVRLYERGHNGARETEAGKLVLRAAQSILSTLRELDSDIDDLERVAGLSAHIGVLPSAEAGLMPGVLARLAENHADIQVHMTHGNTGELIPRLNVGKLDLILGRLYEPASPDGLMRDVLYHEPICLMARTEHPIFTADGPTIERIARYKLILPALTSRLGQEIDQLIVAMGIDPSTQIRSTSTSFTREMLQSSDHIALTSRLLVKGDVLRGAIKVSSLPIPAPPRPGGIIYRPNESWSASMTVLVDTVKSCIRDTLALDAAAGAGVRAP